MIVVRIGNDVRIKWEINKHDGSPENFIGAITKVWIRRGKSQCEIPHSVHNNIVSIDFLAKEQFKHGIYDIILQYSKVDPTLRKGIATYTIDKCEAIELVPKTCDIEDSHNHEYDITGVVGGFTYAMLSEREKNEITQRLIESGYWAKINIVDTLPSDGIPGEFYATLED